MRVETDRHRISQFYGRDPALHAYELGDLDPRMWPRTTYHVSDDGEAMVLEYAGPDVCTILALADDSRIDATGSLLAELLPSLPDALYMHLSPGLTERVAEQRRLAPHGLHLKMALHDPEALAGIDHSAALRLGPSDLPRIHRLYEQAYPETWFDPFMLETGHYFGIEGGIEGGTEGGAELIAIAGVHVHAPNQRVAALGNVATHPKWRGRGLAKTVTAAVCNSLLADVDTIALNVVAENEAAIACYRRLGFASIARYDELGAHR